jgi:acyl-CoA synthetase (AMP-forming)/AMP-acid ligase II
VPVVPDDDPQRVLDALEAPSGGGPVAVVDHRRPPLQGLADALTRAPAGTWLAALTSGSTAAPRAVCRTRQSWTSGVDDLARLTGTGAGTRVLVPGPLASTLFLHAAWHARQVGATVVPEPLLTERAWDVVHLVPHLLRRLLEHPGLDLAGRTAVVAGAALPVDVASQAGRRGMRVVAYYGAAELSFVAAGEPSQDGALPPFPGVQVQVRDGEVWARSALLALGYLPLAGAGGTAAPHEALPVDGPLMRDDAGWVSVGDRGELLPDGRLRVLGRGGGAVQSGGATVLVADVEAALRDLPGVRDVVVVAVAHDELGEVVGAVVEPHLDLPALRRAALTVLAPEQLPRRWLVLDALPRTAGGKVDRAAAGALLAARR